MAMSDNMLSWLPPYWADSAEMLQILKADGIEIERIDGRTVEIYNDAFIMTSSAARIRQWEKRLNLPPTGTLDERRRKVLSYFQTLVKLNEESIKQIIATLYDGAAANVTFENSTIKIEVVPTPEHDDQTAFPLIAEALEPKKPCHIALYTARWYSSWKDIKEGFTNWQDVKFNRSTWLAVLQYIPD